MGDRANVILKSEKEQVCLYTHWYGHQLPEIVQSALKRSESRWTDFQYLTRIVFCEMIKNDVMGETGFGISQEEHDGEGGRIVTINCDEGTVAIKENDPISISDFVSLTDPSWA